MSEDAIKDLTLMLMYLTSWEESLAPELHKKPDRPGFRPQIRRTWKGYDFGILRELTDEGLVNAGSRSKSASFTDKGTGTAETVWNCFGTAWRRGGWN